jgi:saccharopine dehydrogenase-like NADP-dependent oxidoreductase
MSKVLIVGAGMQGQVITWNLGRNPAVTEVVLADYDEERARFVAGQVGAASTPASSAGTMDMGCPAVGHS